MQHFKPSSTEYEKTMSLEQRTDWELLLCFEINLFATFCYSA
jgi:hypothetical protein